MAGIFKAYDIRGVVPTELDRDLAYRIGQATATFLKAKRLAVGQDMRNSAEEIAGALVEGITSVGCNVVRVGMVATPMTYYAVNALKTDGAVMTTASHNPGKYNGFKITREHAIPVAYDTGIDQIEKMALAGPLPKAAKKGTVETVSILEDYASWVVTNFAKFTRKISFVADAGNGMAGLEYPAVLKRLPVSYERLFFELDGNFPNHEANPLNPKNLQDLIAKVRATKGAEFGVAADGDGDRCAYVDETGEIIPCDLVTALMAKAILAEHKGETILYDLRSSWTVKETIEAMGGKAEVCRVGHSFIKAAMRKSNAIFAGELSGHYYFRDAGFVDSGIIGLVSMLNFVSTSGMKLSEAVKPLRKYFATGEMNFEVEDKDKVLSELKKQLGKSGKAYELDGLSVEGADWWFNVRCSNTEPLVRLNLEAKTAGRRDEMRDKVTRIIGGKAHH